MTMRTPLLAAVTVWAACGDITVPAATLGTDVAQPRACTSDKDCVPELPCQLGFCDPGTNTCATSLRPGACLVGGQCYEPGQTAFGDKCLVCDPEARVSQWTAVSCAAGQVCDSATGGCVGDEDVGPEGDTTQSDVVESDTAEPSDTAAPDTSPPTDTADQDTVAPPEGCTQNSDCQGEVATGPCEGAVCVKATGECVAVTLPAGSACLQPGSDPQCFTGACDADGACVGTALSNTACDDGSPCTLSDLCEDGQCVGSLMSCSDGNPCTLEACDEETGTCAPLGVSLDGVVLPCDDGNACTSDDTCDGATCVSGPNQCPCSSDSDCPDDGNPCNGALICAGAGEAKACVTDPATVVICDTSADGACEQTRCDPADGLCHTQVSTGLACTDGDPCTFGDKCSAAGVCKGTALACDDGNVCTTDSCLGSTCTHTPNASPCDDADACTVSDSCSAGTCQGSAKPCDDNNPCTVDTCVAGSCTHTASPGAPCDDDNPCSAADSCLCDGDGCAVISCVGTPVVCDDDNACTDDFCDVNDPPPGYTPSVPASACHFVNNDAPCSDANVCTTGDHCQGGSCVGAGTLTCPDSPCNAGTCSPATGCTLTPKPNGSPCDDGNSCTTGESCSAGACAGGSTNCACQNNADCSDNNPCNGVEVCAVGGDGKKTCQPGTPVVCAPSGTPCATNVCQPATGQCAPQNKPDGTNCGADDACVTSKVCTAGACTGKTLKCPAQTCYTTTGCDPVKGCQYSAAPTGSACDDGDACTAGEECAAGAKCKGSPVLCTDGNPCTQDSCVSPGGCTYTPGNDGAACDADGNKCTSDLCSGGVCKQGATQVCDDGVACTSDSCDPATGLCVFQPKDAACDDGNACTTDTCSATGCKSTALAELSACNDGNSGTSPDVCFQGSCVGGSHTVSAGPLFSLCGATQQVPVAMSYTGGKFTFAANLQAETFHSTMPIGCDGVPLAYTQVGYFTGNGATYNRSGSTSGTARDMAGRVVVGSSGLVGLVANDASAVDWASDLKSKAGSNNWATVAYVSTGSSFITTSNYLIGGRSKLAGVATLCSASSTTWTCTAQSTSGGKASTSLSFAGSTLYAVSTGCTTLPCLKGTTVGGGWLGSASTDGGLDLFRDLEGDNSYASALAASGKGSAYRGAVQESTDVAWHYGTGGLLYRATSKGTTLVSSIASQSTTQFVDAAVYGGNLLLLGTRSDGAWLFLLPSGADYTKAASWSAVALGNGTDALTTLAASSTTGITVMGSNAAGTQLVVYSLLK